MLLRSIVLAALAAFPAAGSAAAAGTVRHGLSAPVCATSCFAAPAGSGPLFVFSGHGWGHGVGMSQYGAYGYAQHGWTAQQILAHYYPGTTLGTTTAASVRVLLAERQRTLKLSSSAPYTVKDGSGQTHTLAAGTIALGPGLKVLADGGKTPQPLPPPLTFAPGTAGPLSLGRAYRGQIEVDVVDGKLRAINVVGLEQYLYGVVPSEMPSGWATEALKAQAVAARSYALATRKVGAPFDVYSDTRSQAYLGVSQEKATATAAVDATKGQVLTYGSKIATTYFFSTSGGQTESSLDWTGVDLPYLVSVPDPYDVLSPYHNWGPVPVTGQSVAKALKLPGMVMDLRPTPNPAGRVGALAVLQQAKAGAVAATVPGTKLRGAIGLRSTWFSVGVLSLTPPSPGTPVTYGSSVKLTGLVRGVDGVALEERNRTSGWHSAGSVPQSANGAVQLIKKPTITTDYRLATATAAAAYVRVRVAALVRIAFAKAGEVRGRELPSLPGAAVRVERQGADLKWTPVATSAADAVGGFAVTVSLVPGATYRVVVAPGRGYWPGISAPVTVAG